MIKNKLNYKKAMVTVMLSSVFFTSNAQVKIGSNSPVEPNPDCMLEIASESKGLLIPRIPLVATTLASPMVNHVPGMVLYNTATSLDVTPGQYYNDGTKWLRLNTQPILTSIVVPSSADVLIPAANNSALLGSFTCNSSGNYIITADMRVLYNAINMAYAQVYLSTSNVYGAGTTVLISTYGSLTSSFATKQDMFWQISHTVPLNASQTYYIHVYSPNGGNTQNWVAHLWNMHLTQTLP